MGTEYHVDMSRICPQCLDANPSDRSARADVLLREVPDEDEEEDEGNRKEDDEDDSSAPSCDSVAKSEQSIKWEG